MTKFLLAAVSALALGAAPAHAQLLGNVGGSVGGAVNGTLDGSLANARQYGLAWRNPQSASAISAAP